MAVFDKISGVEKAQILGAGVQNSCQVQIMSELRGKTNKICVKKNENQSFGGRFESGKGKACALFFSIKNLGGTVDILCSLGYGIDRVWPYLDISLCNLHTPFFGKLQVSGGPLGATLYIS